MLKSAHTFTNPSLILMYLSHPCDLFCGLFFRWSHKPSCFISHVCDWKIKMDEITNLHISTIPGSICWSSGCLWDLLRWVHLRHAQRTNQRSGSLWSPNFSINAKQAEDCSYRTNGRTEAKAIKKKGRSIKSLMAKKNDSNIPGILQLFWNTNMPGNVLKFRKIINGKSDTLRSCISQ